MAPLLDGDKFSIYDIWRDNFDDLRGKENVEVKSPKKRFVWLPAAVLLPSLVLGEIALATSSLSWWAIALLFIFSIIVFIVAYEITRGMIEERYYGSAKAIKKYEDKNPFVHRIDESSIVEMIDERDINGKYIAYRSCLLFQCASDTDEAIFALCE